MKARPAGAVTAGTTAGMTAGTIGAIPAGTNGTTKARPTHGAMTAKLVQYLEVLMQFAW